MNRPERDLLTPFGLVIAAALFLATFLPLDRFGAVLLYTNQTVPLLFLALSAWYAHRIATSFTSENPVRLAWRLLSLGLLAFLVGDLIYAYHELVLSIQTPLVSSADLFYLASAVLLVAAEAAFLRAYRKSGLPFDFKLSLGLGLAVAAVSLALGAFFLRPVFHRAGDMGIGEWISFFYPVADFVQLSLAVVLFEITRKLKGGNVWQIWFSLVLGFLAVGVADLLYTYFTLLEGHEDLEAPMNLAYLLGYVLFARGGLKQHEILHS